MTTTYHKTFKAPIWLTIDADPAYQEPLVHQLVEQGAFLQNWPSPSFYETVIEMASKGWHHIVEQPFPYGLSVEFLHVAAKAHIAKVFGENKLLGTPAKPWGQGLNRRVTRPEDYEDVFNSILGLEDSMTLSQLFNLGDRCYNGAQRYSLLVSTGVVPRNILSDIAENVIVAGRNRGDVVQQGRTPEQFADDVFNLLETTLDNYKNQPRR